MTPFEILRNTHVGGTHTDEGAPSHTSRLHGTLFLRFDVRQTDQLYFLNKFTNN